MTSPAWSKRSEERVPFLAGVEHAQMERIMSYRGMHTHLESAHHGFASKGELGGTSAMISGVPSSQSCHATGMTSGLPWKLGLVCSALSWEVIQTSTVCVAGSCRTVSSQRHETYFTVQDGTNVRLPADSTASARPHVPSHSAQCM